MQHLLLHAIKYSIFFIYNLKRIYYFDYDNPYIIMSNLDHFILSLNFRWILLLNRTLVPILLIKHQGPDLFSYFNLRIDLSMR